VRVGKEVQEVPRSCVAPRLCVAQGFRPAAEGRLASAFCVWGTTGRRRDAGADRHGRYRLPRTGSARGNACSGDPSTAGAGPPSTPRRTLAPARRVPASRCARGAPHVRVRRQRPWRARRHLPGQRYRTICTHGGRSEPAIRALAAVEPSREQNERSRGDRSGRYFAGSGLRRTSMVVGLRLRPKGSGVTSPKLEERRRARICSTNRPAAPAAGLRAQRVLPASASGRRGADSWLCRPPSGARSRAERKQYGSANASLSCEAL
jgi:hypothetical protein